MAKEPYFESPTGLFDYIADLVRGNAKGELKEKPPLGHSDVQDQIRSAIEFMQYYESRKRRGDYWLALSYLAENLKYYNSIGDTAKYGHILLEVADCLFLCGEASASIACCNEAINLLIASRGLYEWAMEVAATGELLLSAVALDVYDFRETTRLLRKLGDLLQPKQKRALFTEDAHKVARRIVAAYRSKSDEPLRQLSDISPRRKKNEEKNLCLLLIEWMDHYKALRIAVERVAPDIATQSLKT